jgi:F-type H+-transporting ATPase subunit epsilon
VTAVALNVQLVAPDREIWSGEARILVAKTLDGDIGVLAGHAPVIGLLAPGSVVEIIGTGGSEGSEERVSAAVSGGFISVADDRASVLATQAQLGPEVDVSQVRADLDQELSGAEGGGEEPEAARYARALLRAAGEPA